MSALNKILPVSDKPVGEELKKTVNARKLHSWLGVKTKFSDWIKTRISEYGFQENEDFVKIATSGFSEAGNRGASIEYHVDLDMAKELGMAEKTAKGREVRRYFISIEKQSSKPKTLGEKYEEVLAAAIHYHEESVRQKELMELAMPVNLHMYGKADDEGRVYLGLRRATLTRSISRMRAAAELHVKACQLEMLQLLEDAQ